MPARFCACPPNAPALERLLDDSGVYRVGRAPECELRIDHSSVSRFHAQVRADDQGWRLDDTASKNGLRLDGHLCLHVRLTAHTWFGVGDVYCRLELLDPSRATAFRAQVETRRSQTRALSAQLLARADAGTLLPQTLDAVLELNGMERGFIVCDSGGGSLSLRARRGISESEMSSKNAFGSSSVVDRVMREARTIVCCETLDSPWLGLRPSVQLGGIRAIVCMPLAAGRRPFGVIYADSRGPGPAPTELDVELLEYVARSATAALSASEAQSRY